MNFTIAQFNADLHLAGQQRVVVDLAKGFKRRGHLPLVCTTLSEGELVREVVTEGIIFKHFNLTKNYDIRALIPIIRYLNHNKVDVVITHGFYGSLIPRISAILSRVPVFIHVEHNVSDQKRIYHILFNRVLTKFIDKIVCVSENASSSLRKIERVEQGKVTVIPNGLSSERFSPGTLKKVARSSLKRVGIVGRFSEQKGHAYFVAAAANIVKAYKDVEFILVGDGPLRPRIEEAVRELGIEAYCHFYGGRPEVGDILRTLDVFVLASLWEGLPISLLEAQYFGIASVVTDVGGNSEIIENGLNGWLVPPRDPERMARAVLHLLCDDSLRRNFGINGRRLIDRKYIIDKTVDSYLAVISEIMEQPHKKGHRIVSKLFA